MKKLEISQMAMTQGGADFSLGCAWLGWAAGLASAAVLGPVSLAVGAATYAGCVGTLAN